MLIETKDPAVRAVARQLMNNLALDVSDFELLRIIIANVDASVDDAALAQRLLNQFGNARGVFRAEAGALSGVEGMTFRCAASLRFVEQIYIHVLRSGLIERPFIDSVEALRAYLVARLSHPSVEEFCVVYLDRRMRVIGDDVIFRGTFDACRVDPREIMKRTLNAGAEVIILAHNHPSWNQTPSREDARVTREIILVARPLGIHVQDHFIIAGDACVSMRSAGYFPSDDWPPLTTRPIRLESPSDPGGPAVTG